MRGAILFVVVTTAVLGAGCGGPFYPACDIDRQCAGDGAGVCVERRCIECRDDATCGKGRSCRKGRCAS